MTIRTIHLLALVSSLILVLVPTPVVYAAGQVVVRVQGDYPALQENASNFVGTVENRSTASLRRYASHAEKQVREALRALGYYSPVIRWRIEDGEVPTLVLEVEPGKPVKITERVVRVEGPASDDPDFQVGDLSQIAPGQVVNHGNYETVRSRIRNRARTLGYFQGKYTEHTLRVDPKAGTAEIRLVFKSGPRYVFGDVSFEGDGTFEQQLLERFVEIQPGELYSADKVAKLDRSLSNSGYFSSVIIEAASEQAGEDLKVPVNIRLKARDPRSVAAGIGFSTDVGPRFRGTWTEYWINPMGHRRGAETELSGPRQNVTAYYELPLDPPMTDAIRFATGYQREDIEDVESERLTLGQQWRHQLDSEWMRVVGLRWEGEHYSIGDDEGNSQLLLPSIGFSKLVADSPLDPARGYRLQLDVTGAHRSLLSDADIAHVVGAARGLITVGDGHRFLGRLQLGGIATNDFDDVPPSLRFFAGGDQSVRGYGYETLAPEDEDGNTAGGRYLMVGSVEYQYPVSARWRLAAFYDRGNAVDNLNDPLASGVGLGVRWVSPVGPLRLDFAKGLDEELGGSWRIHFSMGPEL